MEEEFRKAIEKARENGENEDILTRDEEVVQKTISELQKLYLDIMNHFKDLSKIFNAPSEKVREYANHMNDLLDRLKVLNDIIHTMANSYGVDIKEGMLPFNEDFLDKPNKQDNYIGAPIIPGRDVQPQPQTPNPKSQENVQPQTQSSEKQEDIQPQTPSSENQEDMQPQTPSPEKQEDIQPQTPSSENQEDMQPQIPNLETAKNEQRRKVTKKDLELARKANDLYCGKLEGYKFSKGDMLFFANNTLEDIKKEYGENVFPVSKEDEVLFDEFIKYQSLKDGLYMTKEERKLMMKNRDAILFNKEIADPEAKKLYDRFFEDCNGDEYEIILRYDYLSDMNKKVDETYKNIEEIFQARDVDNPETESKPVEPAQVEPEPEESEPEESVPEESAPEEPAPVGPAPVESAPVGPAPMRPAPVGPAPVGPAPVGPAPVRPAPVGPAPVRPASVVPAPMRPASVGPTPVQQRQAESVPINSTNKLEKVLNFLDIKILGKRMLVNGKQYEYNTKYGINIDREIGYIFSDARNSVIYSGFLTQEIEQILAKLLELNKIKPEENTMDPNIVYAIVQACKEEIKTKGTELEKQESIREANEKLKDFMLKYMEYVSGNFKKGSKYNNLAIEYNLKEASMLSKEDREVIMDFAELSRKYAKIVDYNIFEKIINKIKAIFTKKEQTLLSDGQHENKENDKLDKTFVEKVPQTQGEQKTISPERSSGEQDVSSQNSVPNHKNIPSSNNGHEDMEP